MAVHKSMDIAMVIFYIQSMAVFMQDDLSQTCQSKDRL